MIIKDKQKVQKIARYTGVVIGFFIFSTIMYYVLFFLNRLPTKWTYFHVVVIVLIIMLIGWRLRAWLN